MRSSTSICSQIQYKVLKPIIQVLITVHHHHTWWRDRAFRFNITYQIALSCISVTKGIYNYSINTRMHLTWDTLSFVVDNFLASRLNLNWGIKHLSSIYPLSMLIDPAQRLTLALHCWRSDQLFLQNTIIFVPVNGFISSVPGITSRIDCSCVVSMCRTLHIHNSA